MLKDGLYRISLFGASSVLIIAPSSYLASSCCPPRSAMFLGSVLSPIQLWHYRLGHPPSFVLNKVFQQSKIPLTINHRCSSFCSSCQLGKNHRLDTSSSLTKSSEPLQLIFSDVWGPAPVTSTDGFKYYVSFQDNYSLFVVFIL